MDVLWGVQTESSTVLKKTSGCVGGDVVVSGTREMIENERAGLSGRSVSVKACFTITSLTSGLQ